MYPVLFKLGRLQVHAYGLLLALSFLIGILWAMKRGEKRGILKDHVMDAGLYVVIRRHHRVAAFLRRHTPGRIPGTLA